MDVQRHYAAIEAAARHRAPCQTCGQRELAIEVPGVGLRRVPVTCEHQEAAWLESQALADRVATFHTRMAAYGEVLPPETYAGIGLEDVRETAGNRAGLHAARQFVATWPERRAAGDGMLFWGPTGTTKTLVAAAIANSIRAQHYLTVVVTVPEMLEALRNRATPPEYAAMLKRADLLVLDELGAEKITEFATTELFAIVDARYRARLPIIITTNLSLPLIEKKWSASLAREGMHGAVGSLGFGRIGSRLSERCNAVEFSGPDGRPSARPTWLSVLEGGPRDA